jgi:3-hydroxypropanoate dehydrogenase
MNNLEKTPSLTAFEDSISEDALDRLFREARTHEAWLPEPVPVELLRKAYESARLGPTSANTSPARFIFLTTPGAKARLKPALAPGNVEKTMAAPVTAIIAWDTEFHESLPRLFPQADFRSYFAGNQGLITETAFRNSSLQAAYFHLGCARLRVGLWAYVWFRRGQSERRVLPHWQMERESPLQFGLWRPKQTLSAQSPIGV